MGQIVFNEQKPKYANKLAITTGSKANDILDENEIWLIDSTINSVSGLETDPKSSTGKGKYDKYIKGDGHTAAKNLPLLSIDPDVPTHLYQLTPDADHQTVSNEQISRWNEAAAGEGGTLIESSDDIKVVNDAEQNISRLELADKQHNTLTHSGLGRKYVKKNIQTVPVYTTETVFDSLAADIIITDTINNARTPVEADIKAKKGTAEEYTLEEELELLNNAVIPAHEAAYAQIAASSGVVWGKRAAIDGRIHGSGNNRYINISPDSYYWSISHCYFDVQEGDYYKITTQKSDYSLSVLFASRLWILTEIPEEGATRANVITAYKEDGSNIVNGIVQEVAFVKIPQSGRLWVNYVSYNVGQCRIEKITETNNTIEVNSLPEFTSANTEYIIQYDYNLAGGVLEMPENSVLKFEGGSIKNGYIKGNNSSIVSGHGDVILEGTTLLGKWKNKEFYPKWFGAAADGVTDDTEVLQRMLDISTNIGSTVKLVWYGYRFKTTHGLYLKPNTYIYGGSIIAEFSDPLDWILQTYTLYETSIATSYKIEVKDDTSKIVANTSEKWSRQVGYYYSSYWQEFDGGGAAINHTENSFIDSLSLEGALINHMVIPEGGDENTPKVADGKKCPIFGGLKINGGSISTYMLSVRNVGIALSRGACLWTSDTLGKFNALFTGFVGTAINGHTMKDCYINAKSSFDTTPYFTEYQNYYFYGDQSGAPMREWLFGNGGVDDSDENLSRPKTCAIRLLYAYSIILDDILTDSGAEVAIASMYGGINMRNPWWEGVLGCKLYMLLSRITLDMPIVYDGQNKDGTPKNCEYDFIGNQCSLVLSNCDGRITGKGGTDGVNGHKYYLGSSSDSVQILNARHSAYPEDSRFVFLTAGSGELAIVNATGTTLEALISKYYKFSSEVDTLDITLPTMYSSTSVKGLCLSFTTGGSPNITFTSADNKDISYFDNYPTNWNMHCEYEISCMYNGTKWIIAAALIG